jgi:hypothetical protein
VRIAAQQKQKPTDKNNKINLPAALVGAHEKIYYIKRAGIAYD